MEDPAVTRFRQYLRINTMQPTPDYASAAEFFKSQAEEIGLEFMAWEGVPGKPVVVLTWVGLQPSLPAGLLNSHVDVVPVFEEQWTHPPFGADKVDGKIYARGAQDMKCVGSQYLETVRRLKSQGVRLARTLHLCFVPDEEIGGADGMKLFVKSAAYSSLNVGFALDEGLASPGSDFVLFHGERVPWWLNVTATGQPGHASQFIENGAIAKIQTFISKLMVVRESERLKLATGGDTVRLGDVTTINVTIFRAGVQHNVVPAEAMCGIDIRLPPTVDLTVFKATLDAWAAESDVAYEFVVFTPTNPVTALSADSNFWATFKGTCDRLGLTLKPQIFPAATDSRYLRQVGIPALGFSPMNQTPVLLHDNDEFLHEDIFLKGVDIYCELLTALGNMAAA